MRVAVVSFPGSNCDDDCVRVVDEVLGQTAYKVWHADHDLGRPDLVILPGGFSYGDYLRCGAISAHAPVMADVAAFAAGGGAVLGICNGFQILTEAGLLPGALHRNAGLHFICKDVHLAVEGQATPFTNGVTGRVLKVPVAHHDGNYHAEAETLARLEGGGQVLFRYCHADGTVDDAANPNGSLGNIAGISNAAGNVVGMMPHPERCAEPLLGNTDGLALFQAALESLGA